ncbi:hypothetical protein EYB26_001720 [Talaromyces marneffei]|uniref:uncharacterized protein n=1 Tax=Talaromyces marneffei TaxID=37727 RepID=UPI0012A881B2|nr:uncharacterized protein EYB26_001720 [Talaromyces marneffei]QGA14067.1 hypothetical protein EYB26_001720 [Talaromyces marneffei]
MITRGSCKGLYDLTSEVRHRLSELKPRAAARTRVDLNKIIHHNKRRELGQPWFLEQLIASISLQLQEHDHHHVSENEPSTLLEADQPSPSKPPTSVESLLSNTIGSIASSQRVKLVFCPSLAHLRAYLSTFQLRPSHDSIDPKKQDAGRGKPVIAILDFLAVHYMSTQFSAQGLSQTLALAVETAARTDLTILLCECNDAMNPGDRDRGPRLWDLHVPLLNGGSIRSDTGRASSSSSWSGRHVSVRQVAQRWFKFEE